MTALSPTPSKKYDLSFARWVYDNVDGGDRLALCMQCGTCSGSCPIGTQMDHGPRKLFMMIRAGMKEAVLTSNTLWNCVSCYNCVVRCPRKVPVAYILHDLATVAVREGYAEARNSDNARFAKAFWWSAAKYGRTDERLVTGKYYFSFGMAEGYKRGMSMDTTMNFAEASYGDTLAVAAASTLRYSKGGLAKAAFTAEERSRAVGIK